MSKILSGSLRLLPAVWMLAAAFPLVLSADDQASKGASNPGPTGTSNPGSTGTSNPGPTGTSNPGSTGTSQAAPDAGPACVKVLTPPDSDSKLGRIQGLIVPPKQAKSEALDNAQLWLANKATGERFLVPLSKCEDEPSDLAYSYNAKPDDYEITLMAGKFGVQTKFVTAVAGKVRQMDFGPVEQDTTDVKVLIVVGVLFLMNIWLARWHNIAIPNRRVLLSRASELKARVMLSSTPSRDNLVKDLGTLEDALQAKFNLATLKEFLFWSRGLETTGWKLLHRVEVALIPDISSAAEVDARLITTAQRLADSDKQAAKNIASRIQERIATADLDTKKQLLKEALNYLYDASDTEFDALTSWQNKAFWLTLTGALFAASLAATVGHSTLFLAGAAGGFLSRLMRQLKRADVPTDYGASWSTLFMSPVSGALAGWFGVVIVMMLSDPRVGILAGPLAVIQWDSPTVAPVLAAAFALGFSERLFDGIMTQLEESIDKKKADSDDKNKAGGDNKNNAGGDDKNKTGGDDNKQTPDSDKSGDQTAPAPPPAPGTPATNLDALHAGDVATVPLDPASLAGVTGVDLKGVSLTAETTMDKVDVAADKVTFTIPAETPPGRYSILLVSSDKRTDTSKDLTILPAA